MPEDAVVRETEVQRGLANAGYPTPQVLAFDLARRIDGRRYLVMEFDLRRAAHERPVTPRASSSTTCLSCCVDFRS